MYDSILFLLVILVGNGAGRYNEGMTKPKKGGRQFYGAITVGEKGQVVIPKALRDLARLQPGDEVDFELRDEEIVLVARRSPVPLGGRFAESGMAARLLEDRARERR